MSISHAHRLALMVLAFLLVAAPATALAEPDKPGLFYEVPAGQSVTLTDIARTTLGSAGRWEEIVELNPGLVRPDGKRMTATDKLPPNSVIVLPSDANTDDPAVETRSGVPNSPAKAAAQPPSPPSSGKTFLGMPTAVAIPVGGAALLLVAGGATWFLVTRKRRKPKPATPPVSASDPKPRLLLDRALRHLVLSGSPLPQIYGAVVGPDRVSLRLTPPQPQVTHPWRTREEGAVWEAPTWQLDPNTPNVPPPFPLLVSVGTIGGDWTAVNLGRAPGLVALTGETDAATQAAAALLEQIAADPGVRIAVIGPQPKARLAPGRVRMVPSAVALLGGDRRQRNPDVTGMLDRTSMPGRNHLTRHLVLVTGPVPVADLELLSALASSPDPTSAVLVIGDVPTAAWRFGVGADGVLDVGVLGLELDSATKSEA